jgi:crotonobetainyl-CoA:carnitine CoA-transferase CaiB-like acyl-CoA transferase
MCPHGCYPCADGSWIAVAVADDAEWQRLCGALDATTLSADPRYVTAGERQNHAAALDADLARLTRTHDAEQLAHRLREAGVPATKSATSVDVIGDRGLWDRELYRFVTDHREGQRPILGPSWRIARAPARIARGAPDLGEDNDYLYQVLREPVRAGTPTGGRK